MKKMYPCTHTGNVQTSNFQYFKYHVIGIISLSDKFCKLHHSFTRYVCMDGFVNADLYFVNF